MKSMLLIYHDERALSEAARADGCAESAPLAEEIRAGGQIARKGTVEVRPVVEIAGLPTG